MNIWPCRLFGHMWQTTHTNRWQMPTRQQCSCCKKSREWVGGPDFMGGGWA